MTSKRDPREYAKELLLGETPTDREQVLSDLPKSPPDDWYAQPAIGANLKTYAGSSEHPYPMHLLGKVARQ